ncbi:MAG: hypothetical protein ACE15B_18010 [Bryobacteraceae bacterium]
MKPLVILLAAAAALAAQQYRPERFFREDFKETPAATPATQEHIANPRVVLGLYGPGREGIKKSHHEKPVDDPYYIWSGTANGNWVVTLKRKDAYADLTGFAKVRWRSKQAGYREARLVLKLANGAWLVSDLADGPSLDWRECEFNIQDLRWRQLNIKTVIEGKWVDKPDLAKVDEIGWTDLMTGGGSDACTRIDWVEVYARPVPR